ncbi:hypothetical protein [Parapedobacter tibetensis]|uniref:hypothetical protein n=1 Tax=Parapedobacter tibetensis TaxID=2972951 RepID=UPI00214DB309|nr:hypothetical protein [Parapedobacter tibetensis]
MKGNYAIRTARWRYIHYADGAEELYDHFTDANEWDNLASNGQYSTILDSLRKFIPTANAEGVPDMKKPIRRNNQ